ncbi:MAG: GtrA family protein, partial [Ruminococcus sp.]|nr:GtrA family protein [Ruminococcus sp.]
MAKIKELYRKYEQVIMYIIMGGCTTLVYYIARIASRLLLGEINRASLIATAIAQIVAITFAFITNKKFVFKS